MLPVVVGFFSLINYGGFLASHCSYPWSFSSWKIFHLLLFLLFMDSVIFVVVVDLG
ncbi:hypothetical protein C1H46_003831 [Malus baccata]|uniref:Uncharacterized protein n=1 Tax=Malus baccata TaxID=106549 RepID=A0A540NIZ7_MALBA|nr:hypothetical protein C1H46_003831 [Malus baccata]